MGRCPLGLEIKGCDAGEALKAIGGGSGVGLPRGVIDTKDGDFLRGLHTFMHNGSIDAGQ